MQCPVAHDTRPKLLASSPALLVRYPEETLILGSAQAYTDDGLGFYQRCERLAGMVQTRFLWKPAYIVTDPAAIEDVLVNHPRSFRKPYILQRLKILFGDGLLTSDGEVWQQHRRLVQPAFGSERTEAFVEAVRWNAEDMIARWRQGEVRNVYPELIDLCMKNIAHTMFGTYDEELGRIVRALAATSHLLVKGVFDVIRPMPFRFRRELRLRVESELADLARYLDRLIKLRQRQPARDDFFGLLLARGLSRQTILDESVTMLLAGHETTASSLVWSLYLLARHPEIADELAFDLQSALGGEAPTYAELGRLSSLRATLDESLRLYPPTHRIARTIASPVWVGGHHLPAGADVIMPQWAVHRSPRWYNEPESFLPSRWTTSFRKALPRFAYFPFSGGPRTCVGYQLAWSEAAVILALLTQRFRFSLFDSEPLVPYEGLTLLPASGKLRLRLQRRQGSAQQPRITTIAAVQ